jgi:YegS/Rv2252/BmrU family lipid kinase
MPRDRHLLIVNPTARHGETAALVPAIEKLLADIEHETVITHAAGHAVRLAEGADGYDVVVAVGGDGTVHEVLNGLMHIPAETRPRLGLLPTGSGNDTRRALGVPADLAAAAMLLACGEPSPFDVGVCNGTYFNNSFAAGLDARVTAKAIEYQVTTRRTGLWLYLTALFHVLFKEFYAHDFRIAFDGGPFAETTLLILAANNGRTYGGGFVITPDALPDDGLLEVCAIDPLGLPEALWRLPFVITGKHTRMRPVHMSRHSSLVIESDGPLPAQIDGEVFLEARYEVSVLPGAIECIVPKRTT